MAFPLELSPCPVACVRASWSVPYSHHPSFQAEERSQFEILKAQMFAERLAKRNRRAKRARAMPEEEPARVPGRQMGLPGRRLLPETCTCGQRENWRDDKTL